MSEHGLWVWLRDTVLPIGHYSRVETGGTAPGFPDVHYQLKHNHCGTIELKHNARNRTTPFTDEKKGMRASQLRWIENNMEYHGVVWIIAEAPPDIFVIHGSEAEEINGSTRENLHKISAAVLHRESPEDAAFKLVNILMGVTKPDG
ncbi:hypothetical protein LCGC14_0366910 [marine sediment metagenome]|uniref:YqaJ viral recombinase domain-containing protein n=1 Tax=marine sediment metagenome TaxID=412755 RepID=A0A0F9T652_9ZZZZ